MTYCLLSTQYKNFILTNREYTAFQKLILGFDMGYISKEDSEYGAFNQYDGDSISFTVKWFNGSYDEALSILMITKTEINTLPELLKYMVCE